MYINYQMIQLMQEAVEVEINLVEMNIDNYKQSIRDETDCLKIINIVHQYDAENEQHCILYKVKNILLKMLETEDPHQLQLTNEEATALIRAVEHQVEYLNEDVQVFTRMLTTHDANGSNRLLERVEKLVLASKLLAAVKVTFTDTHDW